MTRRAALVLAALAPAAVFGPAADAAAGQSPALPYVPAAGPQPAGPGVAWVEGGRGGLVVRRSSGARVPVAVAAADADIAALGLAASEQATAVAVGQYTPAGGDSRDSELIGVTFFGGPSSGPLRPLQTCPWGSDRLFVHGTAVAVPADGCDGVAIHDVATGSRRVIAARGRLIGLAGPYVAWLEPEAAGASAVVFDLAAGAVNYRTPPMTPAGPAALGDDGTVALVAQVLAEGETRPRSRGFWASRDEPRLHPLALPEADRYALRLAGERVAFLAAGTADGPQLGIADLRGGFRLLSRRVALQPGGLGFDSAGATYARLGCEGAALVRRGIEAWAAVEPPRRGCALRLTRRARLAGGRSLSLRISCRGFDADCHASVTVCTRRGGPVLARGATRVGGSASLRLTSAGRRYVRAGGRRLRLEARLSSPSLARSETRVATVVAASSR